MSEYSISEILQSFVKGNMKLEINISLQFKPIEEEIEAIIPETKIRVTDTGIQKEFDGYYQEDGRYYCSSCIYAVNLEPYIIKHVASKCTIPKNLEVCIKKSQETFERKKINGKPKGRPTKNRKKARTAEEIMLDIDRSKLIKKNGYLIDPATDCYFCAKCDFPSFNIGIMSNHINSDCTRPYNQPASIKRTMARLEEKVAL